MISDTHVRRDADELTPPITGRRLRVLAFAYACEPGAGSEPGAGWALIRAVHEFADCVVLVGPEHGSRIRHWQATHSEPGLEFVEVPEPGWARLAKRYRVTWFALYLLWLRRARRVAIRLCKARPFDVAHHATYSTYWLPTPAVRLGLPCVWGPVGGAVTTPRALWPLLGWRGIAGEVFDLFMVRALSWLPATRDTWRRATVRLIQNEATLRRLPRTLRARAHVLNHATFTEVLARPAPRRRHAVGLLLVSALQARKGIRLALRALARTPDDVTLAVLGDGRERRSLENLARRLRIQDRVRFHGWTPRDEVFPRLTEAAAVVFPGLREEGGLALAEALLCGAPVIVLANGGARTIAASATDRSRVALIEPGTVTTTAQRMAEAMTYFSRHAPGHAHGSLLDQPAAYRTLRTVFEDAVAAHASR